MFLTRGRVSLFCKESCIYLYSRGEGLGEVGEGPVPRVRHSVLVCTGILFPPYVLAAVCLTCLLLSETDNDEEN
jgi:hypothetical protein